jgi:hypothetical protein
VKKIKRSKLYLAQETVRVLQGAALRAAVGGDGAPLTKPINCTTTIIPSCTFCGTQVGCPSGGCPITRGCPGSEGCSVDCTFTCDDSCGGNCV